MTRRWAAHHADVGRDRLGRAGRGTDHAGRRDADPGRTARRRDAGRPPADVRRSALRATVGEMHIHDRAAIVRMLLGGDTGAGEAYMDGLWSSPDLPALLRVAALNREALALGGGWWRLPLRAPADAGPPGAAEHDRRAAAATSRPTTTSATTSIGCSSTRR